jgi:hypothetical protein
VLVVRLSYAIGPPLDSHPIATLAATLVSAAAMLLAIDRLSVGPARSLERRMAARLAERGVTIEPRRARFAGLSPSGEPRIYEQSGDWDLGFVVLDRANLRYFGEESSFALDRGRVLEVRLGAGLPSWIRAPRVVVSWRDPAGETRAFSLRPASVRSLSATGAASRALAEEIRAWQRGATAGDGESPHQGAALESPGLPPAGPVTSASPRELASGASLVRACVLVVLATGAIGAALQLPIGFLGPGMLDAQLAAVLGLVIQRVPYWLPSARPRPQMSREALERAA